MMNIRRSGSLWLLSTTLAASFALAAPHSDSGTDTQSKSFTVQPGGSLQVDVQVGDIRISTWEKNEVKVVARNDFDEDLEGLEMTQAGNIVRVEFDPPRGKMGDIEFDVSVPAQFNLKLRTSGGDVIIGGALSGTVDGSTSGGDIRVGDITGTVNLSTSGGDVVTGEVRGELRLSTSGGDISVRGVTGTADVRTSGGDVRINYAQKSLDAKTAGGTIRVGEVGGEADLGTSGGDIMVDRIGGRATLKTSGGNITLRRSGGPVRAKTAGGNIRADSVTGSIDASTAAGNVIVGLLPSSGIAQSSLSTSVGNIALYISESAKATIDARIRTVGRWRAARNDSEIRSDFKEDSYISDERNREIRATYTLNGGGHPIMLSVSLGEIEIRKMGSPVKSQKKQERSSERQ
jgi:DUF4097 and DUF4098 domain-containing protein YvlB